MKNKDVSTVSDSVYNESDEHVDTISDTNKQVDARNKPIKETHIVDGINTLSVEVGSVESAVIIIGIIRQGITQVIINGGTNVGSNLVTNVLTNSREILFDRNMFQLNTLQSEAFVIGPQDESVESNRKIICTLSDSRNIGRNHISSIENPRVNKEILHIYDTTSNVLSYTDNVKKFNTLVYGSTTQERTMESSRIKEVGVKSIFPEIGKEPDSSVLVKLTNYVLSKSPRFIRLGHPTVETADIWNINFATSTRAKNLNRLRRGTERDDRLGKTHDFETMSKTIAYRNHIKNYKIETKEVFERENWSPERIQWTLTTDMVT